MNKTYTLEDLTKLDDGTPIVCDSIPFNMSCLFKTYENWEVQIIRNVIDFKKKYKEWPNFMTANPFTYENCFAEIERLIEESLNNPPEQTEPLEEFDWSKFDINEPIEKYPIQSLPINIEDGLFITPIFSILWLDKNSYEEDLYKLSFGINPGPDDGEDIEVAKNDEPLKLRLAA